MSSVTSIACAFCQTNTLSARTDKETELHWLECDLCGATGPTAKTKIQAVKFYGKASPPIEAGISPDEKLKERLQPAIWNMIVMAFGLDIPRHMRRIRNVNGDWEDYDIDTTIEPDELPSLAEALLAELAGKHDQQDADEKEEDEPEREEETEDA